MILHITSLKEWEKALLLGEYTVASLKLEGFIHCSTLKQTVATANNFFKGQNGLVLLCIDEHKLTSECKYEDPVSGHHNSSVGVLFPHIYGPINLSAVIKTIDFPTDKNEGFTLPKEIDS